MRSFERRWTLFSLLALTTSACTLRDYQPIGRDGSGGDTTCTMCGTACFDLQTDVHHCGDCATDCDLLPHVVAGSGLKCVAGVCQIPPATCEPNFARCGTPAPPPSEGCNADLRLPANCGMCGNTCMAPMNGTPQCMNSTCSFTCDTGFNPTPAVNPTSCVGIAAPQLIGPMSTAFTTSLRPKLRIKGAAGIDGAQIQVCADRACTTVQQTIDVPMVMSGVVAIAQPPTGLTRGVHFWRAFGKVGATVGTAPSPVWEFSASGLDSPTGNSSWGTMLDVNSDGLQDFVVGGPRGGTSEEGAVSVYHGVANTIPTTPATTLTATMVRLPMPAFAAFGTAVASAGDINGDGYGDLVVGAPGSIRGGAGTNTKGRMVVLFGSSRGVTESGANIVTSIETYSAGSDPSGTAGFATDVHGIGDVDGDGYGDVGVFYDQNLDRVYVYRGGPTGLSATPATSIVPPMGMDFDSFGAAGDINGDGYSDLMVGDYETVGSVRVYMGGTTGIRTTPSQIITYLGTDTFSGFGLAEVGVGDANGDGYADVAVSAVNHDFSTTVLNNGAVYVYPGTSFNVSTSSTAMKIIEGSTSTTTSSMGRPLAIAGDVDGNGLSDLVVGYSASTNRVVQLYRGDTSALVSSSTSVTGPSTWSASGQGVTGGDINNDGRADLAIIDITSATNSTVSFLLSNNGVWNTTPVSLRGLPAALGAAFAISAQ